MTRTATLDALALTFVCCVACAPSPGVDAGTPDVDAGTAQVDAGTAQVDAGTAQVDAGTPPVDAGTSPVDAGHSDAGAGQDAGLDDGGLVTTPLTVDAVEDAVTIAAGGEVVVHVSVVVDAAFTGAILVTLTGAPTGVTAAPLVLAATAAEGTLVVTAAATATPGAAQLTIVATAAGADAAQVVVPLTVRGGAGTIDGTFDVGGATFLSNWGDGAGLRADDAGALVLVGRRFEDDGGVHAVVARVAKDGALDGTFADAGIKDFDFETLDYPIFRTSAIDDEGRIVALGYCFTGGTDDTALIARFDETGALDTTFATDGTATIARAATGLRAQGMAFDSAGSIYFAGEIPSGAGTPLIGRVAENGALDTAFGTGGFVQPLLPVEYQGGSVYLMTRLVGGDFVAGGRLVWSHDGDYVFDSLLYRFAVVGTNVADQVLPLPIGDVHPGSVVLDLLPLEDGGLLAAGATALAGAPVVYLARFDAELAPDPTFGTVGFVLVEVPSPGDAHIARDATGRIVLISGSGLEARVWRFQPDGSPDASFGDGGRVVLAPGALPIPFIGVSATAIAIQPSGRIVLAIGGSSATEYGVQLVRLWD